MRIPLPEEVGQKEEKFSTYERVEEVMESTVKEITSKSQIREQMVSAKEEDVVSTWYSGGPQMKDSEPLEHIEPVSTEHEAELQETQPCCVADFPEDKAVDQSEGSSLRSISPLLKEADLLQLNRDVAPLPEKTHLTKKGVPPPDTGFTSQKDLALKKTSVVKKQVEADIPSTFAKQREVTESSVLPMDDLIQHEISCKEITVEEKWRVHEEVSLFKQAEYVEEEDIVLIRSITPPPENLTQVPLFHPMTKVS
uniref:Uncharacterized protein n=2 Tax=Gasterosteus aculeatus TaxID=69293 RepID=G3N516_GASAC